MCTEKSRIIRRSGKIQEAEDPISLTCRIF
jgi:hypothetical protein